MSKATKATVVNLLKGANIAPADQEVILSKLHKDDYDVFVDDLNESTDKEEFVSSWITSINPKINVVGNVPTTVKVKGIISMPHLQAALAEDRTIDYTRSRIAFTVTFLSNQSIKEVDVLIGLKQAARTLEYPDTFTEDIKGFVKLFKTSVSGKGCNIEFEAAKAGDVYLTPEGVQGVYQNTGNYVRNLVVDESDFVASTIRKQIAEIGAQSKFDTAIDSVSKRGLELNAAAADMFKAMLASM